MLFLDDNDYYYYEVYSGTISNFFLTIDGPSANYLALSSVGFILKTKLSECLLGTTETFFIEEALIGEVFALKDVVCSVA